jgi:hypothetical protein
MMTRLDATRHIILTSSLPPHICSYHHRDSNMPGTTVCNFEEESGRTTGILRAIARSENMLLVCGAGISTASGIPVRCLSFAYLCVIKCPDKS